MDRQNVDRAAAFLKEPRIALVGLSRDEKSFSRYVFRELVSRGIDVVPVTPDAVEIEGRRCWPRVGAILPPVTAALIMTAPDRAELVHADGVNAGIRKVWLHRGAGVGAGDARAVAFAEQNGLELVKDLCPFMVLPGAALGHRIHGFFRRL
jgi:predicted CoA-binding protein